MVSLLQGPGTIFLPDLNQKLLYRIRPDGLKEEATLLPGNSGFAYAVFANGREDTEFPNILLKDPVMKRPAAAIVKNRQVISWMLRRRFQVSRRRSRSRRRRRVQMLHQSTLCQMLSLIHI